MTQTTPSQAVEAKVDEFMRAIDEVAELETDATLKADETDKHNPDYMAADAKHVEARNKLKDALRSALTSQQEVAAPVGDAEVNEAVKAFDANAPFRHIGMRAALEEFAASRVPVASLAEPEKQSQGNLAVAESGLVQGAEPADETYEDPLCDCGQSQYKPHSCAYQNGHDIYAKTAQPTTPAPGPVAQGEATYNKQEIDILVHQITGHDDAEDGLTDLKEAVRMLEGKTILDLLNAEHDAALLATPANMAVGAVGGVGADFRQKIASIERSFDHVDGTTFQTPWVKVEFLHNDWMSRDFFADWLTAPEQATTGSGQDSERLDFLLNSPSRYAERSPSGMWRVYEDRAPANATAADWRAMSTRYERNGREAIDAAILSTASPADGGDGK